MAFIRTVRFADGSCTKQLGNNGYDNQGNYGFIAISPAYPCDNNPWGATSEDPDGEVPTIKTSNLDVTGSNHITRTSIGQKVAVNSGGNTPVNIIDLNNELADSDKTQLKRMSYRSSNASVGSGISGVLIIIVLVGLLAYFVEKN